MSAFDHMRKDKLLKKSLDNSKKATPDERINNNHFSGEDGEYYFLFIKLNDFDSKDGVHYTEFQFRAMGCEGQEHVAGEKMNIFLSWTDNDYQTVTDVQEQFFVTLQQLGIETADRDDKEIEEDLKKAVNTAVVKAAVGTGKKKAKDGSLYRNFYLRGPADDPGEVLDPPEDEQVEDTDEDDSYETADAPEEESGSLPSEYVGFVAYYTAPDEDEATQYWIGEDVDDDAGTVSLVDEDDTVVHEDVDLSSVEIEE